MTIDTTQALLIIILVSMCKDGLLMWCLIARGDRATATPAAPPVAPGPVVVAPPVVGPGPVVEPPKPPVVVPPVPVPAPAPVPPAPAPPVVVPPIGVAIPRNTHITATVFATPDDSTDSKTSAYTGKLIGANELGAALPEHLSAADQKRLLRVFWGGSTVDIPPIDVGPWYPSSKGSADPYWRTGTRPRAETDLRTNHAGIDLTPATWKALGHPTPNSVKDYVSWDWVDALGPVAPPVPVPPIGPTQPPAVGGTVLHHNDWPTQAECPSFYGDAATVKASLVNVQCPWLMNGKIHTIQVHSECAASLERVLNYIWEYCGKSQDKIHSFQYDVFDGSYVPRNIAGTSTPSVHSYGAALDFDAAKNPQHDPLSQTTFKSNSLIVYAFKAESWIWGGDWTPASIDAMHFQAARVR